MADGELPWQTAFWCVTAVALNTMSQPAGRTLGLESKYSFYIRASPIVCLGDICYTTLQVWSASRSYPSLAEGLAAWKDLRFETEDSDGEDTFDNFRKNTVVRIVSFVLGALLPALKIYACKEIPWTQVVCSIYLGCFISNEALLLACSTTKPSRQFMVSPGARVPYLSRHMATAWTVIAFDRGLLFTLLLQGLLDSKPLLETGAFLPLCSLTPLVFAFLTGSLAAREPDTRLSCLFLSVFIGPALWSCGRWIVRDIFLAALAGKQISDVDFWIVLPLIFLGQVAVSGVAAVLAFVGGGLASKYLAVADITVAVVNRVGPRYAMFSARLLAACWLMACVLLYARLYNSESTHDPRWLRIFG